MQDSRTPKTLTTYLGLLIVRESFGGVGRGWERYGLIKVP
jgi:hypothetical protein